VLTIADVKKGNLKAVGLFSGGLDSSLAVKIIVDLGFDVVAFRLCHPFETGGPEYVFRIEKAAKGLGAELYNEPAGAGYLEVIRSPKYGYGKAMNPCIDCHVYMIKRAHALAKRTGAAFVFTGEVLGSRPMSQRREALDIVERESGLAGRLLRPLSAKLLPPTEMEKNGLVEREKLYDIKGRSRKKQMNLAKTFGINGYPTPAGGCLLTEVGYSAKLADIWVHGECGYSDLGLLRIGRHFRLPGGGKAVVGRNEKENGFLEARLMPGDLILEVKGVGSPITLLRNAGGNDTALAAAITVRYSDATNALDGVAVSVSNFNNRCEEIVASVLDESSIKEYRVTP
jgi:tRNA-specific 2-thiouridylase